MKSELENLPNEIFLSIFSYLSWDEILISLWSLNERIHFLICSTLSRNKNGILFNKPGLSYSKFTFQLLPLILNSPSLSSNITFIHCDGIKSISFDFIFQDIFYYNNQPRNCFPNLKSLNVTQCLLSQSLIQILSSLIQYQLNDLTLSFHKDTYKTFDRQARESSIVSVQKQRMNMFQEIVRQLFSDQCQLTSLQLDIEESSYFSDYQYFQSHVHRPSDTTMNGFQTSCQNLRFLKIRLHHASFLEYFLEHVPNLEQLSIHSRCLQCYSKSIDSHIESSLLQNGTWFNKIPKLECLRLNSSVDGDLELAYLKWLLNNANHVIRLELHLYLTGILRTSEHRRSVIDADFIRQYCLPDQIINLKYFDFYIRGKCQSVVNDSEKIIHSFQIHPCFIDHQWTNVKCFYNGDKYQHILSSNLPKLKSFNLSIYHPNISHQSDIHHIKMFLRPSLHSFLEQFNELCPNASCITIYPNLVNASEILMPLEIELQMEQLRSNQIQFRNVTKLRFGSLHGRHILNSNLSRDPCDEFTDDDIISANVFAHIISMCVQLQYLFFERFEWFLNIDRYASVDLREDALTTVRHAEFGMSSCNIGGNESIRTGGHLVALLSTYLPHLQTLCLWRSDDFPWTSIRPDFRGKQYGTFIHRWRKCLTKPESITQHATVFEQDLCRLFRQLRELIYLDIYGKISHEKVQSYRLMVQTCFGNSRTDIQTSRFRLWK